MPGPYKNVTQIPKGTTVSLRIARKDTEALRKLARADGRSLGGLIRVILQKHLENNC